MTKSDRFIKYLKNKNMVYYTENDLNNSYNSNKQHTNVQEALNGKNLETTNLRKNNFILFTNIILSLKSGLPVRAVPPAPVTAAPPVVATPVNAAVQAPVRAPVAAVVPEVVSAPKPVIVHSLNTAPYDLENF
jgi:hypothetical protein